MKIEIPSVYWLSTKITRPVEIAAKSNFTPAQLEWASQHDWFISGSAHSVVARATEFPSDDERHYVTITNFQQLRAWAGY